MIQGDLSDYLTKMCPNIRLLKTIGIHESVYSNLKEQLTEVEKSCTFGHIIEIIPECFKNAADITELVS